MNLNHFVSYEYIDIIGKNMIESHNLVSQVFIEISKRRVPCTWETFLCSSGKRNLVVSLTYFFVILD